MVVRTRPPRKLPPAELSRERRCYVAGILDHGGVLRSYARGNGREIIRLTVPNLSDRMVESLRADFGVGSRLGRANADGRGLTWSVEGRWACLRIGDPVIRYLEPGAPLQLAFIRLGNATPAWEWPEGPVWEQSYHVPGTTTLPPLKDPEQLAAGGPGCPGDPGTTSTLALNPGLWGGLAGPTQPAMGP